jgi:hypothetical protein
MGHGGIFGVMWPFKCVRFFWDAQENKGLVRQAWREDQENKALRRLAQENKRLN